MHQQSLLFVAFGLCAFSSAQLVLKAPPPPAAIKATISAQSNPPKTVSPPRPSPIQLQTPERPSISVSGPGRAGGQPNGPVPFIEDLSIAPTFIPASTVVIESFPTLLPGSSLTCKTVVGDSLWPDYELWTAALPGVQSVPYIGRDAHPNYFLAARTVEDVQRAVAFINTYNIRLTVISSGQDYLGRSDAPNGLLLSVKHLKGIRVLSKFQPTISGVKSVDFSSDPSTANIVNAPASSNFAVSIGAGVTTQELNDALEPSELFTMGPAEGNIAVAGGWSQAGSHGPLTGFYGLGADNVLEYQVVTADGKLKIANAATNGDLFWALRGGGGGTFAIVVQATVRAYPSPRMAVSSWWLNSTISTNNQIYNAAAYLHTQLPDLSAAGVYGYYYIYPSAIHGVFLAQDKTSDEIEKSLAPVYSRLQSFAGMSPIIQEHDNYNNFKEFFDYTFGMLNEIKYDALERCRRPLEWLPTLQDCQNITTSKTPKLRHRRRLDASLFRRQRIPPPEILDPRPAGRATLDSQLLADSHLQDSRLAGAIAASMPRDDDGRILPNAALRGYSTLGAGSRRQFDASMHPAWRRATVLIVGNNVSSIRALSSDMASSLDEGYWNATNWKTTFFGSNYERLHAIKQKYDPKHVFYATPGIGADAWSVDASRLCRSGSPDSPLVEHWGNDTVPQGDNQNPVRSRAFPTFTTPWPAKQSAADIQAAADKRRVKSLRDVSLKWRQTPSLQPATVPMVQPTPLTGWIPATASTPGVQFTPVPGDAH